MSRVQWGGCVHYNDDLNYCCIMKVFVCVVLRFFYTGYIEHRVLYDVPSSEEKRVMYGKLYVI